MSCRRPRLVRLAIWVPWPVLSEGGMDGHGQARTNTDGMVREYAISQDPHPPAVSSEKTLTARA